jgi:hypothetical protein
MFRSISSCDAGNRRESVRKPIKPTSPIKVAILGSFMERLAIYLRFDSK